MYSGVNYLIYNLHWAEEEEEEDEKNGLDDKRNIHNTKGWTYL
jgi:hypothetical protein